MDVGMPRSSRVMPRSLALDELEEVADLGDGRDLGLGPGHRLAQVQLGLEEDAVRLLERLADLLEKPRRSSPTEFRPYSAGGLPATRQ